MSLYPQVVTTVSALLASNPTYNLVLNGKTWILAVTLHLLK
jgi:hypothetical protein